MTQEEVKRYEKGKKIIEKIRHLKWGLSLISGDGHYADEELVVHIKEFKGGANSLFFGFSELDKEDRNSFNDYIRDMIKSLITKYEKELKKL